MNVTSWDTEQNAQTPWKDGKCDCGEEKEKRREVEGTENLV